MLTAQRKQLILERLARSGQVSVTDLSHEWGTSEDTIRRDLRDLAEEGLVQRVHGGALPASPAVGPYERREELSGDVKDKLARAAAALVRPGQMVGVDGGTTNLRLVRALPRNLACTIVTHSPVIAAALADHAAEVLLVGGRLFRHSLVAVGSETTEAVGRLKLDVFFLGATGLHPEAGATTGDWEEAAVKRAFCRAAADTVLLVSPEKWGAASPHQIVPVAELTTILVDSSCTGWEVYADRGLTVVRV